MDMTNGILAIIFCALIAVEDFRSRMIRVLWLIILSLLILCENATEGPTDLLRKLLSQGLLLSFMLGLAMLLSRSPDQGGKIGGADIWMLMNLGIPFAWEEYLSILLLILGSTLIIRRLISLRQRPARSIPLAGIIAVWMAAMTSLALLEPGSQILTTITSIRLL